MSLAQFNFKPSAHSWSIAECMKHLLIIYQSRYQAQLQKKMTTNHAHGRQKNYRSTWVGRLLMGFVNPQKKRKIPTLKSFTPSESAYDMRLQTEYWAYLQELQNYIAQADGLDLNKIKLGTSLSDWLPMNLGDYFQVEAYHHRLHLEQAKRVMQNPQFPQ
ncbi:MAG: DinB family protein [Microscillaceae bacterium]|nr:DinB family protein [Microscillaceae bacterium]